MGSDVPQRYRGFTVVEMRARLAKSWALREVRDYSLELYFRRAFMYETRTTERVQLAIFLERAFERYKRNGIFTPTSSELLVE